MKKLYGYLCEVRIDKEILDELPEEFAINIKDNNGISIFCLVEIELLSK